MIFGMKLFSLLVMSFVVVNCLPTKHLKRLSAREEFNQYDAYAFLVKYGYVEKPTSNGPVAMRDLSESLKKMQRFAGIEETGYLDDETVKMMVSPRCGVKDPIRPKISKRFVLGSAWSTKHLTYSINSYPSNAGDLKEQQRVDHETALAFKYWSDQANLSFRRVSQDEADIQIDFFSEDHNDRKPFDGQGAILAHAFFPESGDLHLDDDETWNSVEERNEWPGKSFLQVMVHEIGHVLGIDHSNHKDAIMYAYYEYRSNFQLAEDDIHAVQALYGLKQESIPCTTTMKTLTTTRFKPATLRIYDDDVWYFPRRGNLPDIPKKP